MVNLSLVDAILREQDDPGSSTTRQIRDIYNIRSGEHPIVQHSDDDQEFQAILLKALEAFPVVVDDEEEDKPISYTVKLKDGDEGRTPAVKRRSIIKLPKEAKSESESEESSSDTEKNPTVSSITHIKPFSPLFLNNMKKFGVPTDWLAKRSNSARQSSYSRSSIKSNMSKLDAMIKSASAKPVKSSRKLSFVEGATAEPINIEIDKENADPSQEVSEPSIEVPKASPAPTPYDLSSEEDEEDADDSASPNSKAFSLRIPRVHLSKAPRKRAASSSIDEPTEQRTTSKKKAKRTKAPVSVDVAEKPSDEAEAVSDLSSPVKDQDEEEQESPVPAKKKRASKKEKRVDEEAPTDKPTPVKVPKKRASKKEDGDTPVKVTKKRVSKKQKVVDVEVSTTKSDKEDEDADEPASTEVTKKPAAKKDTDEKGQARIEQLKKLLRTAGIRQIVKKATLEELPSIKARIDYLKSLFDEAGYKGSLTIKDCEKFREKRDAAKELEEIRESAVAVQGHVKGGRTLRGEGRTIDPSEPVLKRKRAPSTELEDNADSSDDEKPVAKKRRILQMEASPEVSENEAD